MERLLPLVNDLLVLRARSDYGVSRSLACNEGSDIDIGRMMTTAPRCVPNGTQDGIPA